MDRRLHEAIVKGDVSAFLKLVEQDGDLLKQTTMGSSNTSLHLAARFGHAKLAAAILELRPEMVAAENAEMETPLHEACREGWMEIVTLLQQIDPREVYKVNRREESTLFVACEGGRVEVVKHLLGFPLLLTLELDLLTSSLHIAASAGHTETVKELLKERPALAWKEDRQGRTPLHLACSEGHLEITRELLRVYSGLPSSQDLEGLTPLHHAAARGRVSVIDEILSTSRESTEIRTSNNETILHVAVKNNQFEALRHLTEILDVSTLIDLPNNDGNTILHLAVSMKIRAMVIYLLKLGIDVNARNGKGQTALDVVESDASNTGSHAFVQALQEAGAKRGDELPPISPEIQHSASSLPGGSRERSQHSGATGADALGSQRQQHGGPSGKVSRLQYRIKGIESAREKMIIVTVLIATVTFAAGVNPPGGFDQDTGKVKMSRRTSFKVFMALNNGALVTSLGSISLFAGVIPLSEKAMIRVFGWGNLMMWPSALFMSSAYIAAVWTIMPHDEGTKWVSIQLLVLIGVCILSVFLVTGVILLGHWRSRRKLRKKNARNTNSPAGESAGS